MKKWMTLLLAMALTLAACGGETQEEVAAWVDGLYRGRHLQDGEF